MLFLRSKRNGLLTRKLFVLASLTYGFEKWNKVFTKEVTVGIFGETPDRNTFTYQVSCIIRPIEEILNMLIRQKICRPYSTVEHSES